MRFHLPAYLLSDLDGTYGFGMAYTLTQSTSLDDRFALLSAQQRAAVQAYLHFIEDEPEYGRNREHIQRALSGFWAE